MFEGAYHPVEFWLSAFSELNVACGQNLKVHSPQRGNPIPAPVPSTSSTSRGRGSSGQGDLQAQDWAMSAYSVCICSESVSGQHGADLPQSINDSDINIVASSSWPSAARADTVHRCPWALMPDAWLGIGDKTSSGSMNICPIFLSIIGNNLESESSLYSRLASHPHFLRSSHGMADPKRTGLEPDLQHPSIRRAFHQRRFG